jgi:hypothetical protein
MPPNLACKYTTGEQAVLTHVAQNDAHQDLERAAKA